jgi:uroporphyrinogen decarboxylase
MFRRYVKPYLTRLAEVVHAHGKTFLLHVCGAVRPLLPDLIEAGVDILEPIQTSAAGMEVEGLKRDFGNDICFYGSIDLIRVLSRGTPATVRDEVLKNFRVLGKGGGFVVGPGHTYIQPDVPLTNILAMYEAAFRECRY